MTATETMAMLEKETATIEEVLNKLQLKKN
jgi:hypothetical protein